MQPRLRNKLLQIAVFLSLLPSGGSFLYGQVTAGAISGTVSDPTGAAIPDAKVTIKNQQTGIARALTTDKSGFYSAEGLPVGQYTIDVTTPNFKESVTSGIQIDPGERRANNVALEVGSATAQVTVSANTEQVNTESSESGGTLTSTQIDNLMLNGRNFQTLAISVPGVSSTNGADGLGGGGLFGGTKLIVNGTSVEYTTYTIDGIYNMNSGNLANIDILPVVDGISEFSVLKDNYSAKYGFAGSGQVVVVTKSGTDTFHGSAWDYLRNNAFDANNYFSTSTPALHQNIYGYTLGGPVIIPKVYNTDRSKKTFFFASNQWQAVNAASVQRGAVFPQAMRNGNFSSSPTLTGNLTLDAHSEALLASEGKTNCIAGPTTLNPACFDPIAVGLLNAYVPLPNNPSGGFQNYINENPQITRQLDYQFRVDHQISPNHQLTGRIMYEPVSNRFPYDWWQNTPYTTITDSVYTTGFNGLLRVQSQLKPNLINIAGIAYTDDRPHINVTKGGQVPDGLSIIQSFPDAPVRGRIPNITIDEGWTGNGVGSQPISASDGEGLIADDVSWVRGNHVLQAGALYMFGIKRQTVFTNPQGSFTFSGVHTGDPAADYMLGLNSSYSQASSEREGAFHYRQGEAYAQDDWRVTHRLTLNLGLRWVYFSNDTVSGDQVTSFNPVLYQAAQAPVVTSNGSFQLNSSNQPLNASGEPANLLNGLAFAGQNGVSSGFFTPVKTNFGPRVGFAYDAFGNGTTSIRGGYGIGYSRIPTAVIYYAFGQNPPYNQSANVLNSLLSNGTAGGTAVAPTPQNLDNVPFSFTPTQIQSYSLTLEQQLERNMVGAVAYVGSQTRHLTSGVGGGNDINWPLPVTAPSVPGCLSAGQPVSASYAFDPCINAGTSSANYTRPYLGYAQITQQYDKGTANYNALQASVNYRARSSQFSLAYTWGKTLATVAGHGSGATTSQGSGPQNPRDWAAEYGPPSYDFTNNITGTWVYAIPFFSHSSTLMALALGNWSFQGLFLHQSGFALSPSLTTSTAGEANRPNVVGQNRKLGKLSEWFDTSAFASPAYGFYGDAANGTIRGPGYTSVNTSLYKTFPIHDRFNLQFRVEAFNVLNHPNFNNVDTGLGDGNYGQVTSAGDPRIMEFALKLFF
jgi:Carboxypeptidase regulatory-like domain/TonB-dependent Receptor Plug Domain